MEKAYPADYRHGNLPLGAFLEEPVEHCLQLTAPRECASFSPAAVAFLDIETTGLSDGAGTYAFLVGLGRFERNHFHLYQVFMRSPAEEQALLLVVADLLRKMEAIVTFNGRGFDLPVLQSRYTMAHMPLPWEGQVHLDLLPPARQLWRLHLSSCRLASLEECLLGVQRDIIDLPGWKIPSLYHAYLQGADEQDLLPVFYHNAQDILSLVTLAVRQERFLQDPWGKNGARSGLEFYALGRLYEKSGQTQEAVQAYRAALLLAMPQTDRERAWEQLSLLLKRQEAWEEAVEIWQDLLERPRAPLFAHVELAKYYEHHCKDLLQAAMITQRAIAEHGEHPLGDNLAHRLERLQKKLSAPKKEETA